MRAFVPAPMCFRWTSGVPPIERELSSKMRAIWSDLVVGDGLVHVHQLRRAGDDAGLRGDALGEPDVASHHGARADPHRAQDGRARVDDDAALDVGMAIAPLDDPALGITGEVERAERHALVDRHLVPDLARLTDHHPGPVVDEEAPPDACPRMDVDAGTRVGVLAHDARDDRHTLRMEEVRQSIHRNRLKTRVGEDDLLERLRGRIAVVGRLDVGPQDGTNVRDLGEQLQGCRLGPGAAVLAVGGRDGASALEAQPPLDLRAEPPGDRAHARHRASREVGRDEVARLEVSGEEHAQQILHHAPDDLAAREAPAFEVGEFSLPPVAREDRADTVLELAVVGRRHGVTTLVAGLVGLIQRGLSSTTGMLRLVPAWYSSYAGHCAVMIGQTRRLSSGVPVRALTGRTLSRTWILTSGCATRFRYHPGFSGAPPFDATTT